MPLSPNLIERAIFLNFNQGPGPTLDMWSGPAFFSVLAALRLNLFETLGSKTVTAQEISTSLNTDLRGTTILLNTLTSLGYIRKRGEQYATTPMTRKWLMDGGGGINFTPFYLYWGAIMENFMPHLAESIRSGQPVGLYEWIENQPEVSRHFQQGMIAIAHYVKGNIVKALSLSDGSVRLLDVGGGHGVYSIALAQAHPQLTATIFDSPQALVTGHIAVKNEGLTERIDLIHGNFLTDDLPMGYDLALVFNIVHGLLPKDNVELLNKIRQALNPGGRVVVLEQIQGLTPLPLSNTIMHILSTAYFHLLGGQVYTFEDIHSWLVEAGFKDIQRKNILKASSALIIGVKP